MTRRAENVYTEQQDIARIEAWVDQLADEAQVAITLTDGTQVEGYVAVRPTIQVFHDGSGREGMNALVRIDDLADPAHIHFLWLDRIVDIQRMGTA
jgi:uncharacterized protein DUF3247